MEAAVDARDAAQLAALTCRRLAGDAAAAASLLRAAAEAVGTPAPAVPAPAPASGPLSTELLRLSSVSLAVPRGRFDLTLTTEGLMVQGKAANLGPVPWADIRHLLRLPKPETYRKAGMPARAYYLVLPLRAPLALGKQTLGCLVINADGAKPLAALPAGPAGEGGANGKDGACISARLSAAVAARAEGESEQVTLARVLAAGLGVQVEEPTANVCQLESVRAYRGFEDGALYPLRCGICFLPRPALFLPAAEVQRVSAGREGGACLGASSTDVLVEMAGGAQPQIFNNVAMDDVQPLLEYAKRLTSRQAKDSSVRKAACSGGSAASSSASGSAAGSGAAASSAAGSAAGFGGEDDDEEEEADEDFQPEDDDSAEDGPPAPPPRRAAPQRTPKRRRPGATAAEPVARRTRSRAAAPPPEELRLLDRALDAADAEFMPSSSDEAGACSP